MPRIALYRDDSRPVPRAEVVLEPGLITLSLPDGTSVALPLDGCAATTLDAAFRRRFVRMLIVEAARPDTPDLGPLPRPLIVITPPERGAIAPRASRLVEAPVDAVVVEPAAWEALAEWVMGGGRLTACSIAELARLATIASQTFAALIGEVAAQIAIELMWEAGGPWRGGIDLDSALRPLAEAGRTSVRAAEALVAALSAASVVAPRRRRLTG